MTPEDIKYTVLLDCTDHTKGTEIVLANNARIDASTEKASRSMEKSGEALTGASSKTVQSSKAVEEQARKTADTVVAGEDRQSKAARKKADEVVDTNKKISESNRNIKPPAAMEAMAKSLGIKTTAEIQGTIRSLEQLRSEMLKANSPAADLHAVVTKIASSQKELANMTAAATARTGMMAGGVRFLSDSLSGAKDMMFGMVAASGLLNLAEQLQQAIQQTMAFEQSWVKINVIMRDSPTEKVEEIRQGIFGMSAALGTATELTEGLYQTLSSGITDTAEAMQFIQEAAMAAKGGFTSTFTAVNAGTSVLQAYGLEAEKATEVFDVMAKTVDLGKITFEQMASSLGNVVPIAASLGVNFKTMSAAIATLTLQGLPAAQAITAVRGMLTTILKPSQESVRIAQEIGVAWNEAGLKAQGFVGLLKSLQDSGAKRSQIAQMVGDIEAINGVMALTSKTGLATMVNSVKGLDDAIGASRKSMEVYAQSFAGQWDTLKNSLVNFSISVGEIAVPAINKLIGLLIRIPTSVKLTLEVAGNYWAGMILPKPEAPLPANMIEDTETGNRYRRPLTATQRQNETLLKLLNDRGIYEGDLEQKSGETPEQYRDYLTDLLRSLPVKRASQNLWDAGKGWVYPGPTSDPLAEMLGKAITDTDAWRGKEEEAAAAAKKVTEEIEKQIKAAKEKTEWTKRDSETLALAEKSGASYATIMELIGDKLKYATKENGLHVMELQASVQLEETLAERAKKTWDEMGDTAKENIKRLQNEISEMEKDNRIRGTSDTYGDEETTGGMMSTFRSITPGIKTPTTIPGGVYTESYDQFLARERIEDIERGFNDSAQSLAETSVAIQELSAGGENVLQIYEEFGGLLERFPDKLDAATRKILEQGKILATIKDGWRQIGDTVSSGIGQVFENMITRARSLGDALKSLFQSIKQSFANMLGSMMSAFMGQFVNPLMQKMGGMMTSQMGSAQGGFLGGIANVLGSGVGSMVMGGGATGGFNPNVGVTGSSIVGNLFGGGSNVAKAGTTAGMNWGGMASAGAAMGGLALLSPAFGKYGGYGWGGAASNIGGAWLAGAGIGTMIMPGIGTLIGAAVGQIAGITATIVKGIMGKPEELKASGAASRDMGGVKFTPQSYLQFAAGLGIPEKSYEKIQKDILFSPKFLIEQALPNAMNQGMLEAFLKSLENVTVDPAMGGSVNLRPAMEKYIKDGDAEALNKAYSEVFSKSNALNQYLPNWKNLLLGSSSSSGTKTWVPVNRPIGASTGPTVTTPIVTTPTSNPTAPAGDDGQDVNYRPYGPNTIVFAPQITTLNAKQATTVVREEIFPAFIAMLQNNTANSRVQFNKGLNGEL